MRSVSGWNSTRRVVIVAAVQFVEHRLDVALLHRRLLLDVVGQFLGLHETLVIDGCGEPLAIGRALLVVVL